MDKLTVALECRNLDELKSLLQKASDQLEQLQKTLQKIEEYKADVVVS